MKVVNQDGKFIIDQDAVSKIEHMVEHGYGCVIIDDTRVTYSDSYEAEGEQFIVVKVGDDGVSDDVCKDT